MAMGTVTATDMATAITDETKPLRSRAGETRWQGPSARRSVCLSFPAVWFLGFLVATVAPSAWAQWRFDKGVTFRTTYTDNVNLSEDGESDFIFDVTPRFSITRADPLARGRINLDVQYGLSAFQGAPNSLDDFRHNGQAVLSAEVVKRRFFIEGRATASQQTINNRGANSDELFSLGGNNLSQTFTYQIGPVYRHHFGPYADGELRYMFDGVINDDTSSDTDSTGTLFQASLRSGRKFARTPWRIVHSRENIDNDDRGDVEFIRTDASLSYVFSRQWVGTLSVGWDDDDFPGQESGDDGFRWQVSGTYRPTSRTSITAGYGDQFTGSNFFFDLEYRGRRTIVGAGVTERRTTVRDIQLNREVFTLVDSFGQPVVDPLSGQPIALAVDLPSIRDDVVNIREYRGRISHRFRSFTSSLQVFREERTFEIGDDDETVEGITARVSRQMNTRGTIGLFGSWRETTFDVDSSVDERWDIGASYTHRFGPNVQAGAEFRHVEGERDDGATDFTENRISLRLNVNF